MLKFITELLRMLNFTYRRESCSPLSIKCTTVAMDSVPPSIDFQTRGQKAGQENQS